MNKKNIQAVLFDLDGTVIDTTELIRQSFRYTCQKVLGKQLPDEELLANVGRPLEVQMRLLSPDHADELVRVYREHNHRHHDELVRPLAGIEEILEQLRQSGVKTGIVTSKSRWLAERGLKICRLERFFDCMVAADDVENAKPAAEPVLRCLEKLGVSNENAVYVGDSPYDIEAGRNAGVITVAICTGPFSREKLAAAKPDFICADTVELKQVLEAMIAS